MKEAQGDTQKEYLISAVSKHKGFSLSAFNTAHSALSGQDHIRTHDW